jgi:hypothetical protein
MKIYVPPSAASPCDDGLSAHSDVALSHRQFGVCFIVRAHTLLQRKWRHLPSSPEYNHSATPDTKALYMPRKSTVLHQINFSSTLKNAPKIMRPLILDFPSPPPIPYTLTLQGSLRVPMTRRAIPMVVSIATRTKERNQTKLRVIRRANNPSM